jgi:hypothetical protein
VFARLHGVCRPDQDVVVRSVIVVTTFLRSRFAQVSSGFFVVTCGFLEVVRDAGIVGIGFYSDRLHFDSFRSFEAIGLRASSARQIG